MWWSLSFWIVSNTKPRDNGRLPLGPPVRKLDKRLSPFNKGKKTRPSKTLHPQMMTGSCQTPPPQDHLGLQQAEVRRRRVVPATATPLGRARWRCLRRHTGQPLR